MTTAHIALVGLGQRGLQHLNALWQLDEARVADVFAHFLSGPVERFALPGSCAINFLLHDVLGGGGIASLRNDPQGKGYGQLLLAQTLRVPATLIEALDHA